MKILLVRHKCTRTEPARKGLAAAVLLLTSVGALSAWTPAPLPLDTAEAARWNSLVPRPVEARVEADTWTLPEVLLVSWPGLGAAERASLAERLDRLCRSLSRQWREVPVPEAAQLTFRIDGPEGEGYRLTVGPHGAVVRGSDAAGRYYALVSLVQLLPPTARLGEVVTVACGEIVDQPQLSWRGLMLDSSRHMQSPEAIESILELMALHKLNRFHWHLTDDQGWRLPVNSWPRLTEVGAWRLEADGTLYGGSYSEAEIRRLVAFAARRHIVVVPEVDLPGHSSAALAAYPELSATGALRSVPLDWGVADGVLSIGRSSVKRFTSDVLATLVELFPGPWIHWGGDEVYRTPFLKNAESQQWMKSVKAATPEQALAAFWADLARQTLAAGRVPIGWDDAGLLGLPPQTILQWWDDPARALAALKAGHSLIASWKETLYLDYPELDSDGDRAFWMPPLPLAQVARLPFWPPGTPESRRGQLLGLEATLFTERAPEPKLGRKLFPRLSLVADLAWTGVVGGAPGWNRRIAEHRERLSAWGVGMAPALR